MKSKRTKFSVSHRDKTFRQEKLMESRRSLISLFECEPKKRFSGHPNRQTNLIVRKFCFENIWPHEQNEAEEGKR